MKKGIIDSVLCALATVVYFAHIWFMQSHLATEESFSYGLSPLIGEYVVGILVLQLFVPIFNYICLPKRGQVMEISLFDHGHACETAGK